MVQMILLLLLKAFEEGSSTLSKDENMKLNDETRKIYKEP